MGPVARQALTLLLLLALFGAGVASGVAAERLWGRGGGPPPGMRGPLPPERMLEEFQTELDLTAEQLAVAREALAEARATVDAQMDQARPQMMAAMQRARARIRATLTEEQARKFDRMAQRLGPPLHGPPMMGGPPHNRPPPPP